MFLNGRRPGNNPKVLPGLKDQKIDLNCSMFDLS